MNESGFKDKLLQECQSILTIKIKQIDEELLKLKDSAESDTKSSMGDKYETGREMIMQERGKLEDNKSDLSQQLSFITSVNKTKNYQEVEYGALVKTDFAVYFIAAAIGKIDLDKQSVFVISAGSPIAQAMLGKNAGESFQFNKRNIEIKSIE